MGEAFRVAITGAASGIGAETARILKARGAEVTAFDIAEPAQADDWIAVDMADPQSIDAALSRAGGRFDALCNIAGIPPRTDNAEAILRVNFLGLRRFATGFLDRLAPGASIVNLSSRAGHRWRENLGQVKALSALDFDRVAGFVDAEGIDPVRAYDLSKEAVTVWTMAVTGDLIARGLRMNAVSPAAIETRILNDFLTAFGERATKAMARVGRAGRAGEVAELVAFLASPESGWIRGADIPVDGGTAALALTDALALPDGI